MQGVAPGSVGSWTEPPRLRLTRLAVSSSAMAWASGRDRASRSSLVTTRGAGAAGGESLAKSEPLAVSAGEAVVDIDPFRFDAELGKGVALAGEVLGVGGDAGVADQQSTSVP